MHRAALPALLLAALLAASTGSGLELLLLHTNDMHARYEQTSR